MITMNLNDINEEMLRIRAKLRQTHADPERAVVKAILTILAVSFDYETPAETQKSAIHAAQTILNTTSNLMVQYFLEGKASEGEVVN